MYSTALGGRRVYLSKAIANYFLDKAEEDGENLTPLKLIKLVYISHGWHLGFFKKPLIQEYVEAWEYGPVIADLYHSLKHYGAAKITDHLSTIVEKRNKLKRVVPTVEDYDTESFLDTIWEVYKENTAFSLSDSTHEDGSPWDTVVKRKKAEGDPKLNPIITDPEIQDYYEKKINEIRNH